METERRIAKFYLVMVTLGLFALGFAFANQVAADTQTIEGRGGRGSGQFTEQIDHKPGILYGRKGGLKRPSVDSPEKIYGRGSGLRR